MDFLNNGMPSGLEDFRCVFQYASWTEYWRDSREEERRNTADGRTHRKETVTTKFGCIKS